MSINVEEALNLEEFGVASCDEDGNVLFYITSGVGDPTGNAAPVPTLYLDQTNADIWRKFGANDNDWALVEASSNSDLNIDGGRSDSLYLADMCISGGDASGN